MCEEFGIQKGLHQRDLLASFLYSLIVAEDLNNIYKFGNANGMEVFMLQLVDDTFHWLAMDLEG